MMKAPDFHPLDAHDQDVGHDKGQVLSLGGQEEGEIKNWSTRGGRR